jgi:hypothetical protein
MNLPFKTSPSTLNSMTSPRFLPTVNFNAWTCSLFTLVALSPILEAQGPAKLEPPTGCYIGAFIVNDANVKDNVDSFEVRTGKEHAIYFSYASFSQPFPVSWVSKYASAGAIVQIAFEPDSGLAKVVDGAYLRTWARAARASGAMILLRFASEMNGNWVPWYGDPSLYIQKFRLVHDIMAEEAPNVAMVWCPNDVPHDSANPVNYMHSYYPGDAYVDWVGIDFYCVYYFTNGTPERVDPRDKLRKVYDVYSSRKPIIVCEWAAAHYTARVAPAESCVTYAQDMMTRLYANAQSEFPRLKAICWFDWNSVAVNKSNFSLTDNAAVLAHYRSLISSPHFLSSPYRNVPTVQIVSPAGGSIVHPGDSVTVRIDTDAAIDSCVMLIDSVRVSVVVVPPFCFPIPCDNLDDGMHQLRITAYAS